MMTYIVRRLLWLIPVIFTTAAVTFILMRNTPGGPWDKDSNKREVDAITLERLKAFYGLDKPLHEQFFNYMIGSFDNAGKFTCGFICGNLGPSYKVRGQTVQGILFEPPEDKPFWDSKAGYSFRLGILSLTFAVLVGIPVGVVASLRQNSWVDYVSLLVTTAGVSVPSFVVGIFALILFGYWLKLIPIVVRDWSGLQSWLLPAVILGFGTTAFTARLTRASMLEVLRQDYVRTARAKGLHERVVIIRHMIKNALIPVVTILGPALAGLVTGSFIIERLFSFPGMGREYVQAISSRDYSMIMGTTLIYVLIITLANLSVDLVYSFIDPRIRLTD